MPVTLLAINRSAQIMTNPSANTEFAAEDTLFVVGDAKNIQQTRLIFNQGQPREKSPSRSFPKSFPIADKG